MSDPPRFGPIPVAPVFQAAMVHARDAVGRHLMQLRDDRPGLPGAGLWSLFGGEIEPGESPEEAARREFAEETGIRLLGEALRLAALIPSMRAGGLLHVFSCARIVEPGEIRLGEGAGFAFATDAQLDAWPLPPHLREALSALT